MGPVNAGARVRVSRVSKLFGGKTRAEPHGELKHPDQKKPGGRFGGRSRNQESESGIA